MSMCINSPRHDVVTCHGTTTKFRGREKGQRAPAARARENAAAAVSGCTRGRAWRRRRRQLLRGAPFAARRPQRHRTPSRGEREGMARPLRRAAGARTPLAVAVAALLCCGAEARSAAARASSSASGNNAAQGPPELAPTTLPAPLPAPLLAIQDTVFASSAGALAGTSVVCGDIEILQNGNTRPSDLGDGFSRLLKGATDSIAAVIAVRAPRAPGAAMRCAAYAPLTRVVPRALACARRRPAPPSACPWRTWTARTSSSWSTSSSTAASTSGTRASLARSLSHRASSAAAG
jgi:hypothetical protein